MKCSLAALTLLAAWATSTAVDAIDSDVAHPKRDAPQTAEQRNVDEAIGKGMTWLGNHPANLRDREVVEVAEEIMFYYALLGLAGTADERKRYHSEIASRHAAMTVFNRELLATGFHLHGVWGPLTYPPLTHIISRMGMDEETYRAIVDDLVAAHPYLYPAREAMQLWIAVYMERLGYMPATPVDVLAARSTLRQEPRTGALLSRLIPGTDPATERQATVQAIYDLTHEVFSLTDFGALPVPAELAARREYYSRLFDQGIRWAIEASAVDILAELLVSAHLLGLSDLSALPEAVGLILRIQESDGSFGVTNPDRPNSRRHGVLTCLLALKTLGSGRRER